MHSQISQMSSMREQSGSRVSRLKEFTTPQSKFSQTGPPVDAEVALPDEWGSESHCAGAPLEGDREHERIIASPVESLSDNRSAQSVHSDDPVASGKDEPTPAPNPTSNRRSKAFTHTAFGLKPKHRYQKHAGFLDPRDYENKYPEDPMYEELSDNARVWRVYLDEVADFDVDMVEKASDGLDLLLVFAGLFSAVLTTFVVQTSQSLSNNYSAVSASLLSELVTIQRAMANDTSVASIPHSDTISGPLLGDIWVNGLWFLSLTLSLSTALLAVLARQWLHQYTSITSGTSRDRSLIRQYRYDGLMKWRVPTIISLLPVLLRVALGLFLVGLVIFLVPLNSAIAWVVGSITCVVYVTHTISNILPIFDPQCPFRTPNSDILQGAIISVRRIAFFFVWLSRVVIHNPGLRNFLHHSPNAGNAELDAISTPADSNPREPWPSLKEIERKAANTEEIGARAVAWLLNSTSNPPTTSIALQSLGAFSSGLSERLPGLVPPGTIEAIDGAVSQIEGIKDSLNIRPLERLLRSRHAIASSDVPLIRPWVECYPPPDALYGAKASLLLSGGAMSATYEQPWRLQDLFLHILDPNNHGVVLPQHLWDTLKNIHSSNFHYYLPSITESPSVLHELYRFAFMSRHPREVRNSPFHVSLTEAPEGLMQQLAIAMALKFRGSHPEHRSVEEMLEALLIISGNLWSSISSARPPPDDNLLDSVSGVWAAIASECPNAEISPHLSESLSKHAASILKVLLHIDNHFIDRVRTAVCTLGGEVESLTYAQLFIQVDQPFEHQSTMHQTFMSEQGANLWIGALDANAPEAYLYFINQDLVSKFATGDLLHTGNEHDKFFLAVLPAFISGLARHSLPRNLEHICHTYLFQPDRLFAACVGLGLVLSRSCISLHAGSKALKKMILALVSLDPGHSAWDDRRSYLQKYIDIVSSDNPGRAAPSLVYEVYRTQKQYIVMTFRFLDEHLEARKVVSLSSESMFATDFVRIQTRTIENMV
ncbi:hypothetical protein HGRIS_014557 [Hohenbuehelia grisea]|uniref:DUF6535 domain-containing protein n=1 Tax=Hohenbuehelia grisea TaxID=104357 RepID=A0ABR3JU26_9AGAR